MMVTAKRRKNFGPPIPKQNDESCLQEEMSCTQHALFVACQIDFKNKQLFYPLS